LSRESADADFVASFVVSFGFCGSWLAVPLNLVLLFQIILLPVTCGHFAFISGMSFNMTSHHFVGILVSTY
jgi:hypothetical protein